MSEQKPPRTDRIEESDRTRKGRTLTRADFLRIAGAAGVAAAVGIRPRLALAKPKFDTPTITCVGNTDHTIFLQVCAGASGAPAGFSVQWVKHSDYPALTCGASGQESLWPASDSTPSLCKASFSGSPGCSIYNLAPNACVTVEIGNLNDAVCGVGLSNCGANELACGNEYVFRAFAHANNQKNRSDYTANQCCSTEACSGCTNNSGLGYWKNHACQWPAPFAPGAPGTAPTDGSQCAVNGSDPNTSCACDSANTIVVGSNAYNQCQLLCALARDSHAGCSFSPAGNALVILAHQLIAAKLNLLNGASGSCTVSDPLNSLNPYNGNSVNNLISIADGLIAGQNILTDCVASGGPGNTLGPAMLAVKDLLELFNQCDDSVSCAS